MIKKICTYICIMFVLNIGFIFSSYALSLDYSGKMLKEVPLVDNPEDIVEMDLSGNELINIDNIRNYKNLEILYLQRNSVYDIEAISYLKKLRILSLNGNLIEDISPIEYLVNLEKLYLVDNNIWDISSMKNLIKLKELYIKKGNNIDNYSSIKSIVDNIEETDISEVIENTMTGYNSKERDNDFLYNFFFTYNSGDQLREMSSRGMLNKDTIISYDFVKLDVKENRVSFDIDRLKANEINDTISIVNNSEVKILNSIYNYGNYDAIFNDLEVSELIKFSGKDGLVLDFEGLSKESYDEYYRFISNLYQHLNSDGKLLFIAIEPGKDVDYKIILENCHNMILMAHDYDVKRYNDKKTLNNYIYNPQSPSEMIIRDLNVIRNQISIQDMKKILLQVNFSISQWKVENKTLLDNDGNDDGIINPNKPSYKLLINRMNIQDKIKVKYRYYNHESENPFLFYNEGGVNNTIWYEDKSSISHKISITRKFGLGGLSVWRIGNIPDSNGYDLDVLNYLKGNMEE